MHLLLLVLTTGILYGMPDTILSDLQRIQDTAARILTKCGDLNYPSINLLKTLHWLTVRHRITFKTLILTFKAYHKTASQYVCDLIIAVTSVIVIGVFIEFICVRDFKLTVLL